MKAFVIVRRALLAGVIACGCCLLTAGESATAKAPDAASGVLLGSSQAIEQQVDAANRHRVMLQLTGVPGRPDPAEISPQQLQSLLGEDLPESPQSRTYTLDELEIEVRAPRGVPERPLQARIPMGLAGLAWGLAHPREAWRLFLPVLA
jgi:hypothetical protein